MALRPSTILGPDGQPFSVRAISQEIAVPSVMGTRSTAQIHPSIGLSPQELAMILRDAEDGDAERYLALASDLERKYPHYASVLGTRKRQVAQLDVKIDAASDSAEHIAHADFVRTWVKRPDFEIEAIGALDAIGKGFSVLETIWNTLPTSWVPGRLKWKDQRWFQFDRIDRETLRLRSDSNPDGEDLAPGRFVVHRHYAMSGLTIQAGVAWICAWPWMFQNFSIKDWASFAETYGQPLRLGKYPAGASPDERRALLRAVADIAGDAAAIIPDAMSIDFKEVKGGGDGAVFKNLAEYMDRQVSKVVLGQTATTDAIAGGHAVGREHDKVREDIERSDAKQLAGTLQRDVVNWMVALNFGPQEAYPTLTIGRPEQQNVELMLKVATAIADRGGRVSVSQLRDAGGLDDPSDDDELLGPAARSADASGTDLAADEDSDPAPRNRRERRQQAARLRKAVAAGGATVAARSAKAAQARQREQDDILAALEETVGPITDAWLDKIQRAVNEAPDLESLAASMVDLFPTLGVDDVATVIGQALALGNVAARDLSIEG